jgi:tetratricopeptide (TPR) repeat protein
MKCYILSGMILILAATIAFSGIQKELEEMDGLHDEFQYQKEYELLEKILEKAAADKEKAEVYWRLARAILYLGDEAEDRGEKKKAILPFFEKGEEFAEKAIGLDSKSYIAYYWKSANLGRWGQVKGIMDSLFKADPMKKLLVKAISINQDHADSFYVLGELYDELPGWPVSFGNIDYAVSLGRKAVFLHERELELGLEKKKKHSHYIKCAKHLHKRNWTIDKRNTNQEKKINRYKKESDVLKKNFYFEGNVTLKDMSDREEAKLIIDEVIAELGAIDNRNKTESDDLKDAIELRDSW